MLVMVYLGVVMLLKRLESRVGDTMSTLSSNLNELGRNMPTVNNTVVVVVLGIAVCLIEFGLTFVHNFTPRTSDLQAQLLFARNASKLPSAIDKGK